MKNIYKIIHPTPIGSRTVSAYTAAPGSTYINQFTSTSILVSPIAATTYVLIGTMFVGANTSSMYTRKYKNGSPMDAPDTPGNRTLIDSNMTNRKNVCNVFFTDTITDVTNYDLVGLRDTTLLTYNRNGLANGYPVDSNFFKLLMTVGGGLRQAPITTTINTTFDSGSVASGTFADPSLSVTITPTNAASNLLIVGQVCVGMNGSIGVKLQRDDSDILVGATEGSRTPLSYWTFNAGSSTMSVANFMYMIPAGSTAATTIKVLLAQISTVTGHVYLNRGLTDTDTSSYNRGVSFLTVYEFIGDE